MRHNLLTDEAMHARHNWPLSNRHHSFPVSQGGQWKDTYNTGIKDPYDVPTEPWREEILKKRRQTYERETAIAEALNEQSKDETMWHKNRVEERC